MQRERGGRNDFFAVSDPFRNFRGFNMMPSLFGGRDPFDDPFFTRPFGSIFESSRFENPSSAMGDESHDERSKGIVIEELGSDDEGQTEEDMKIGDEPSVEHPDDAPNEGANMNVNHRNYYGRAEPKQAQARSSSFQSCKVTYGGLDGAYYTSSRNRRMGSDGVVMEETKEADTTTGKAAHRVSRGIRDKGHSVTRKLNADGKVDTKQTLHNLNEEELAGFEEAWKGNVREQPPGRDNQFDWHRSSGSGSSRHQGMKANRGGWALPGIERSQNSEEANNIGGRTKRVVRINID